MMSPILPCAACLTTCSTMLDYFDEEVWETVGRNVWEIALRIWNCMEDCMAVLVVYRSEIDLHSIQMNSIQMRLCIKLRQVPDKIDEGL